MTTTQDRARYTAALRRLADALDANPTLPLPFEGHGSELSVFAGTRDELVAWTLLLDGKRDKQVSDGLYGFQVVGAIDGFKVRIYGDREQVCRRVVTGTREVGREVPDPEALAAVPTVTVTETVEDVEWVCEPLLAEATS